MTTSNNKDTHMSIPKLIAKKRDGDRLTLDEINYFVKSVVDHSIEDSQLGAMLMAIFLNGLDLDTETAWLTDAMCNFGERLKWPAEWHGTVRVGDKHSTGGVGDKVSIHLAPALAACGVRVPMISGRGLGHTGGTLDKLESVPGVHLNLSSDEMHKALADESLGYFIAQQTDKHCPADRTMYKTRDVTSTVNSIPLAAALIMSKKIIEGLDALVLDVKFGRAAVFQDRNVAKEFANAALKVARGNGVSARVLLTDMNMPLGRCIGNSLEVLECVAALTRPAATTPDLRELTVALGGNLLELLHMAETAEAGEKMLEEAISSGHALKHFCKMLVFQGASNEVADTLCSFKTFPEFDLKNANARGEGYVTLEVPLGSLPLPHTELVSLVLADSDGFVADLNALEIGLVCFDLGSGRLRSKDDIDHAVGIRLLRVYGESVKKGEPWAELHHRPKHRSQLPSLVARMQAAITIASGANSPPTARRIVAERIHLT